MAKPMLAREYDRGSPPEFLPALVQPKLDGVRMLARLDLPGGAVRLWTRTGKPLDHLLPAFGPAVAGLLGSPATARLTLDGELYAHGAGFQAIVSAVRNVGRAAECIRVAGAGPLRYHVYDLVDPAHPRAGFAERHARLAEVLGAAPEPSDRIELVPASRAATARAVDALHDRFVSEGYEGAMVRDPASPYEPGKRAPGLLKLKRFQDAEFRVVGFVEAGGKDRGTVVFECEAAPGGPRFRARPQGTREERARMLRDAPRLVGSLLTVRFQGRTLDGLPRFPVGVAIRDYE